METGIHCEDCGSPVPSLGSLEMHRLRYHSGPKPTGSGPASKAEAPAENGPAADGARPGGRRTGAALPLGLAIVVLLAGGAVGATRPRETGPTNAELLATVHRATLTAADFPAGWTADPPSPAGDGSASGDRKLADCIGIPYEDRPNDAESNFSTADRLSAASQFQMAPSVARARADLAALAAPAALGCVQKSIQSGFGPNRPGESYELTVTRSDPPPALAGKAAAYHAAVVFHRGKLSVPSAFDMIFIQHGRIEASLMALAIGKPSFPAELLTSLATKVGGRLDG